MNPRKIVLFFFAVSTVLLLISVFFPKNGIRIGGFTMKMPDLTYLYKESEVKYADISKIVKSSANPDSLPDLLQDTKELNTTSFSEVDLSKIELADNIFPIAFDSTLKSGLYRFFDKLTENQKQNKPLRIMHYGDSQIEGDRITAFLRNKFQKIFGGGGPGLLSVLQVYDSYITMNQQNSENWQKYAIFGADTKRTKSKKYGVLAAFAKFFNPETDSTKITITEANISISESKFSYSTVKQFNQLRLFYGNNHKGCAIKIYVDGSMILSDSLKLNTEFEVLSCNFSHTPSSIVIKFFAKESPDFYGISLEKSNGIAVDNIPLRGNSGTFFTSLNFAHVQRMYQELNPGLFILQFGGNVMPYTKNVATANQYGEWFYAQIMRIHKLCPDAAVIVIGPSDMSIKENENYITYPMLEAVRNAMKSASLKAGAGYWDLYEAMGGKNSMPSWVEANPPLAGTDYTHFTPKGAGIVANMFYNALMLEYVKYKNKKAL